MPDGRSSVGPLSGNPPARTALAGALEPAAASSAGAMDPRVWRVAGVVLLAPMMTNLDSTIVNVALSSIRDDLHAPLATAQWTLSGYLLALALALPMNGWLVDRLGA